MTFERQQVKKTSQTPATSFFKGAPSIQQLPIMDTKVTNEKGTTLKNRDFFKTKYKKGAILQVGFGNEDITMVDGMMYRNVYKINKAGNWEPIGSVDPAHLEYQAPDQNVLKAPASSEDLINDPGEHDNTTEISVKEKEQFRLTRVGQKSTTVFEKGGYTGHIKRSDKLTALYTMQHQVGDLMEDGGVLYHGTTLQAGENIVSTELDPNFGGSNGARGLTTEPYNAPGYIYLARTEKEAKDAMENFYGQNRERYKEPDPKFCVLKVIIDPTTILVFDPDLQSALRTTKKCKAVFASIYGVTKNNKFILEKQFRSDLL